MIHHLKQNYIARIKKEAKPSAVYSRDAIKNCCFPTQFKQRLSIENRRSERLNTQYSVLIFNFASIIKSSLSHEFDIEEILYIFCTNIREIDLVCLYKKHIVLVLLPDTNHSEAQFVSKRLVKLLNAHQRKYTFSNVNLEIISYPVKTTDARRYDRKDMQVSKSENKSLENTRLRENYMSNINFQVSTYNGSSLALHFVDTFFWQQQIFSDVYFRARQICKRTMDIAGSALGLLLFSPLLCITALLVKITSPGPAFFKQRRVGYRGRYFTFLKFRSMHVDCENQIHQDYTKKLIHGENNEINRGNTDDPFYKITHDPRVTALGKFIRKTSIDELPQLFNVLKGSMSLVGPRPPIPYEVREYKLWHYRRILEIKPGMTGLWQISGRSRTTFDEMVRLDIEYAKNWSIRLDVKILLKTVKVLFEIDGT